jgi:REP element-mobilizing transposase RayT
MLPPNPLVKELLLKSLAQAQTHFPLVVSHFIFEATHAHMFIFLENPDDLKGFMERFKCESSHAINRLLGRKKRTIWCEGYDSPVILDIETAIDKIAYLYENPAKDNLVDSIDCFPGLSSWNHFLHGKTTFQTALISRDSFRPIDTHNMRESDYRAEVRRLLKKKKRVNFALDPNAWMTAFGVKDEREKCQINTRIMHMVKERELAHAERRRVTNQRTVGPHRLCATPIGTPYTPERTGKKMLCLASAREIRSGFIEFVKDLVGKGKAVLEFWRRGERHVPYPVGLYPPALPKHANFFAFEL